MDYDKIFKKYIEDTKIKYGIIFGNEKIVLIKTGADRNIRWYKDKYLKMSHRVHERMGATVICASSLEIENGHFTADKEMISYVASEFCMSMENLTENRAWVVRVYCWIWKTLILWTG